MLFRSLKITDLNSPFNGQTLDLRIEGEKLTAIGADLALHKDEEEIFLPGGHVAPGFVDLGAYLGDPGHEEREDIVSLRAAALAGGYVSVATLPDTDPVRQSVADVAYLLRHNGDHPVDLLPLVALSRNMAGKDMVEMLDLNDAGALAFTDGPERQVSGSLLKRTLEYAKVRQLTVMISPYDEALVADGQIHEGSVSTRLGLPGIPTMSETIPLKQAMEIQAYTLGRLIVHLLSSAEGVAEVRRAKAAGHKIWATVSAHHLTFTVEALSGFDTNFKMLPPLREESDRLALIKGLKDGTIDAIVSNHNARHGEEKDLEFPYADFGALGLQTAFRQALAALDGQLSLAEIVGKFTDFGGRDAAGDTTIQEGGLARLTIFRTGGSSEFVAADIKGKTVNSPLVGRELPGSILGLVNYGKFVATN
jgi:dihydroorotase